jgi:glutathione S-transferase
MPSYKLTYFNARGRAEILRMVFAEAGVEYVDNRIEKDAWAALKPGSPFGQLPILEVDGVTLCQSNACTRYVARKYNMAGDSELEQAQVDMIVDCLEDVAKPLMAIFFEQDETKKAELKKKFAEEQLPGYLTYLEALLAANHGGNEYFVGKKITWADIQFLISLSWVAMAGATDALDKFPKLKALKHRVETRPKIAAWIEKRPKTER